MKLYKLPDNSWINLETIVRISEVNPIYVDNSPFNKCYFGVAVYCILMENPMYLTLSSWVWSQQQEESNDRMEKAKEQAQTELNKILEILKDIPTIKL